jgi:hypothetical protein
VPDLGGVPDRFEPLLRNVDHKAKSTAKYREFERYLAAILGFPAADIYAAYVSKRDNFDVRMTQSPRARRARLRVGLLPPHADVAQFTDLAVRFARTTYSGSSVLLVCDLPNGWAPRWGVEPDVTGHPSGTPGNLSPLSGWQGFDLQTYPYGSPGDQAPVQETLDAFLADLQEPEPFKLSINLDRTQTNFAPIPHLTEALYRLEPSLITTLIENDVKARDVVAIAHRRAVVERFRRLLEDQQFFSEAAAEFSGQEAVWQRLLEQNPWILGVSLTGQLLTSWSDEKLEQVVAGFSIAGPGKRTDALMHTSGRIRALVFAEIKHHDTHLLGDEYRPGVWAPSRELAGGVAQVQRTIQLAARQIGERLSETDASGADTGEFTYLVRPRSFLILGNLAGLRGDRGVHQAKYESFELYRRNLYEPEIITFDELLARAEWHVEILDEGEEHGLDEEP